LFRICQQEFFTTDGGKHTASGSRLRFLRFLSAAAGVDPITAFSGFVAVISRSRFRAVSRINAPAALGVISGFKKNA
jgi:hypothetical protein